MKVIFWLSMAGILYAYFGYPAIMWALSRLRLKPWIAKPICPSVSVVLAVHNGIVLLQRKIDHLIALDYSNIKEIIIVSDGSTDGTTELLAHQHHPLLKTVVLKDHAGKASAVNAGVAQATAEVILFVDIRPEIAPGAIQQLVSNFADPTVGCANGELIVRTQFRDRTSAVFGGLYWRYEKWIRTCESACGSPVGVYGGFYAVRRTLAVPQPPGIILDDMFQPLSILRQGFRVVLDPKAYVYDTWPETVAGEFQRKVRTLAGNFQLFRLAPWTLTPRNPALFQLISHKLMRLLVPFLLVALLASTLVLSVASPFYAAVAVLQSLGLAVAFVGHRYTLPIVHRITAPISAMLILNGAAVVGLYKFLFTRGPLWKIWGTSNVTPTSPPQTPEPSQPRASTAVSDLKVRFGDNPSH